MSSINIDDAAMKSIVGDALLKTLTEENRAILIKEAITHLLTVPEKDRYSGRHAPDPKSPLQMAFERAIEHEMAELVREEIKNNEKLRTSLRKMMVEVFDAALDDQADGHSKVVQNVAEQFTKYLSGYLSRDY
jgi:hypothetical protein